MKRMQQRDRRTAIAGAVAGALVAAGISGATLGASTVGASTQQTKKVMVTVTNSSKFGHILTSGKTLYIISRPAATCDSSCLAIWPALTLPKGVTRATAGKGVQQSKLGTMHLADGTVQVTYKGKPLYYFSGDSVPGQVNGNITDQWGTWSDVSTATAPATTNSGGGGSGSGGGSNAGTGGASF